MEKQFVVGLMQKYPEVQKAHKQIYYFKAVSKFQALLKTIRYAKSKLRLDGTSLTFEKVLYVVSIG